MRGHGLLVGRVDVGIEQAHGHGLHCRVGQLGAQPGQAGGRGLSQNRAGGRCALIDLEGEIPPDGGIGELDLQVVHVVAVLVADQ